MHGGGVPWFRRGDLVDAADLRGTWRLLAVRRAVGAGRLALVGAAVGPSIAAGRAVVPIWSIAGGKLIPRFGAGPVVVAGGIAFAAGLGW
jgi:hypothetical protein